MDKVFLALILMASTFSLSHSGVPLVFADEVVVQTINARILPSIWFSDLKAEEGRMVDVHAGIQNNSGLDFTGTALLFVDDVEKGRKTFSSNTGSLEDVFVSWKATSGNHVFQMKVSVSIPTSRDLISYRSDLAYMSVSKPLVLSEIKDTVVESVSSTATGVLAKADEIADSWAQSLESAKKTDSSVTSGKAATSGAKAADSKSSILSSILSSDQVAAVYNTGIDTLAFLIHQWKWTLSVLVLFGLCMFLRAKAVF